MIVDKINKYLSSEDLTLDEALRYNVEKMAGVAFRRQFMEASQKKTGVVRLSGSGKCARQLAYTYYAYPEKGKETDSRSKIVFFMGDMVELIVVNLAKLAGVNLIATGFDQAEISLTVGGIEAYGHPDGIILHKGRMYLLEVKSMPKLRFERFEQGIIDESYLCQINSYLEALGLNICIMVAINKDSGVLAEQIVKKDPKLVTFVKGNIEQVVCSTSENLPPRAYNPDEKGFWPWQCAYCAYYGHCLIDTGLAEKVLVGKSYKLKVKNGSNPSS